jgi:DNA invertase Pin-like site-specific DNA recombinase
MLKLAVELVRVSTEGQAAEDRAGIPAQRAANKRTAELYGLEIVRSIEMHDVSGAAVLLAPEMQALFNLMEQPEIHGVITKEFSRLMRPENFADYAIMQRFVDTRTVLYLPDGPIDFATEAGQLIGPVRAAMAGWERRAMLDRSFRAKEEKRRRGELAQSPIVLPWGVGYSKKQGWYYKPEADRVRQAFASFLAGEQNYARIAQQLGVTPRGAHLILRNPIWKGFRIIDKKRDPTEAGRYPSRNGRQADRRKIRRSPDEIIRVQVITNPLVTEDEFDRVQAIMDLKQRHHWRTRPDYEHRFAYHGFLTCSVCNQPVHTAVSRRDYYVCRGRRLQHTCSTRYMRREKLEATLDRLFAHQLTSTSFLAACIAVLQHQHEQNGNAGEAERLAADLARLQQRRDRVIKTYIEGDIGSDERHSRVAAIDTDIKMARGKLLQVGCATAPRLDAEALVQTLGQLVEWEHWNYMEKRSVLAAVAPDIRVANGHVQAVGLNITRRAVCSNEVTPGDRDSWPRPA